jgi:hypothetical protein
LLLIGDGRISAQMLIGSTSSPLSLRAAMSWCTHWPIRLLNPSPPVRHRSLLQDIRVHHPPTFVGLEISCEIQSHRWLLNPVIPAHWVVVLWLDPPLPH